MKRRILLAGLATNEHFVWKVAHVNYRSMASTVSVYSSVGLIESACSSARYDESIRYLGGPVGSVLRQNARVVTGQMAGCWDTAGKVHRLPLSYFGTPCRGHVASRCAARADSPRLSAVMGGLSTL